MGEDVVSSADEAARAGAVELDGRFDRALIVEDNPILLRYLSSALIGWGTRVVRAGSIDAATGLLAPPLDLVIADVWLPDGTSRALFDRALALRPQPLVIAISGRASAREAFELAKAGVHSFLAKPFAKPDLARCLRQALEQRS